MRTPEELAETVIWELDNMALAGTSDAWDRFDRALRSLDTATMPAFLEAACAQERFRGVDWELGVTSVVSKPVS